MNLFLVELLMKIRKKILCCVYLSVIRSVVIFIMWKKYVTLLLMSTSQCGSYVILSGRVSIHFQPDGYRIVWTSETSGSGVKRNVEMPLLGIQP